MNAIQQPDASPPPRFIDNGDGTVTDTKLGLMWTQATLSDANVSQHEADRICAACRIGGHEDWRLPDVEELFLLADRTRRRPAIDTAFFPQTHNDWYWTRTLLAAAPSAAWIVNFYFGLSLNYSRDISTAFVRACRESNVSNHEVPSGDQE